MASINICSFHVHHHDINAIEGGEGLNSYVYMQLSIHKVTGKSSRKSKQQKAISHKNTCLSTMRSTESISSKWAFKTQLLFDLRLRFARHEAGLSPPIKYFYWPFQGGAPFVDHLFYFCLVFVMHTCGSVYWYLVVTCWERADLVSLVCYVQWGSCYFPIDILGQVWCLIVSIPDLCPLSYFTIWPPSGLWKRTQIWPLVAKDVQCGMQWLTNELVPSEYWLVLLWAFFVLVCFLFLFFLLLFFCCCCCCFCIYEDKGLDRVNRLAIFGHNLKFVATVIPKTNV